MPTKNPNKQNLKRDLNEAFAHHAAEMERLTRHVRFPDGQEHFDMRLERDMHERFAEAIMQAMFLLDLATAPTFPPDA